MDSEALVRAPSDPIIAPDGPPRLRTDASAPWLRGFHGAIVDVGDMSAATLRHLALTRRSTGLGRLAVLTDLPDGPRARAVPRSTTGARQVAEEEFLEQIVVAPDEPLGAFFDRRLAEAQYLLLPNRGRGYAVAKRMFDLLAATVLLILFAPVFATLVVLIRLDSPGPAIFRQDRVTRGGRIFTFYKFRTMYRDARERFPELYDHAAGPTAIDDDRYYKLADDPRNTRVGRWLRRTTLDELPNLLNVLRGELSMVGPRPDLPELVRRYRPEELACLFTKAGLTGMAQVAGRSLLTIRERLTLDLRYVAHQTMLLDIRIMWRTVVVVLSGKGAF